ncbi:MAG: sigma-54-dependent Fis family transcriptional regulator [Opitutae bacterium]|nr:sigma-54-dependent Fis family transcriptional regulator [Opitutae bacterium]
MSFEKETLGFFKDKEILLLEDDLLLAKRITASIEKTGAAVTHCQNLKEAENAFRDLSFEAALFDLNLPDGESLDLLRRKVVPEYTLIVLMTGEGGVRSAVEALQLGAADYLAKPFDLDELPLVFANADQRRKNARIRQHEKEKERRESQTLFFEGTFREDLSKLKKILEADGRLSVNLPPLLIDGPTGSGKSSYARWVHENGPRAESPFVELNCSAIPENLVESELFGHEKGAFTDAKNTRIGLFEAAHQGTLFLDEIASLSLSSQAKVLLAIENGIIRRVGGTKEIKVDVRIIAAANQGLREMIEEGGFREDLFHRLDLLRLSIPALSSRGKGIIELANHFLTGLSRKYKVPQPALSEASQAQLTTHSWPGNARELIHELERALVMSEKGQDLQLAITGTLKSDQRQAQDSNDWFNAAFTFPDGGFELEKEIIRLIEAAIEQADGNVSQAARLLGVPRDYVRYRLQKK